MSTAHDYDIEFDGVKYVARGDLRRAPDIVLLPDGRALRVMSVMETYPAQIDDLELAPAHMVAIARLA